MIRNLIHFAQLNISPLPQTTANQGEINKGFTIFFGLLGAIALLSITVSGFRYIVAQGDPQKVAQARRAIGYSLVGLVVAALAEAIVTFVIGNLNQ